METYLCSRADDLAYVLDHLPELVVKTVGESGGYGMLIGPASDRARIEEFRERIQANPRNYIAQPVIPLSRVPSFDPQAGPHGGPHVDLRPYCLYDGEKVTIVPGGLDARRAAERFARREFFARRRQQRHLGSARREISMLSRIADSLFWLARYIERAEDTARILDVNYHMLLEQSQQSVSPALGSADPHGRRRKPLSPSSTVKPTRKMSSIFSRFSRTIRAPSCSVSAEGPRKCPHDPRPHLARDVGRHQRPLFRRQQLSIPRRKSPAGPHRFCEKIKFGSHRFHGVTDATLPHDEGWDFLRVGWSLERAEMTARLVDVQYHNLLDEPLSSLAVGQSPVDGRAEIRRRLRGLPAPVSFADRAGRVAEMLILHPQHPRSIRFSTRKCSAGLRAISGSVAGSYANEAERLAGKILERLRYDTIDDILQPGTARLPE